MQGTIYSGEKIQSFACCSAVIKQRRFQRMYSMCDFQNSTVVFPILRREEKHHSCEGSDNFIYSKFAKGFYNFFVWKQQSEKY